MGLFSRWLGFSWVLRTASGGETSKFLLVIFFGFYYCKTSSHTTVDGRNPANQLRLVVYPSIYRVSMGFIHPRWLAGFLPSTVP